MITWGFGLTPRCENSKTIGAPTRPVPASISCFWEGRPDGCYQINLNRCKYKLKIKTTRLDSAPSSSSQSMAQTIELVPNYTTISAASSFMLSWTRSSECIGKKDTKIVDNQKSYSCCRYLGSKIVWKLPLPLHERQFASRTRIHYLQIRICCRLSAYVG